MTETPLPEDPDLGDTPGGGNTEEPGLGNPGGTPYAEPVGGKYTPLNALGFYDHDKTGLPRAVRNDLVGSLPAMVQFAQSHTVDPSGNAAKQMPTLTAQREALLLVTPDPALGETATLMVTVSRNGQSLGTLPMRHPKEILRADSNNQDGRPDYVYSRRAWSAVLPWDWVQPGLELRVSDNLNRAGTLAAAAIDFAAPAELVVHSFELGMLTDPPTSATGHWFLNQPAKAATDYFQTVPLARITAAYYESVRLSRVMVATGVIYDTASATTGDEYSGDMRENTAKSTFSTGINLANYGVTSAGMQSQDQPQVFQSVVAHHAMGKYSNGDRLHSLSGGNGMLTLEATRGNEFSHEIGHHYGLGHYPGEVGGDYFWAGHHHDSGWGYIAYRKRMRANLHWTRGKNDGLSGMPVFEDTYSFGSDAMSGGHYSSALSLYTHYTGYSTRNKIQPSLDKPVLTPSSPTGYAKWNASTQAMEAIAPAIPSLGAVWFNSTSGKFLAPRLQGVPVVTLLGGYDPETNNALLYPALRSNWGNVFNLPATAVGSAEPRQCWLDVQFSALPSQRIAVAGKRMQTGKVNKLHVNLAQSDQPTQAELFCQTAAAAPQKLYTLAIAHHLPAMPAPVTVGKEAGYSAIRAVELPELEAALLPLADKKVLALSSADQVLYDSYADHAQDLSPAARLQWDRFTTQQQQQAQRLNRWMAAYAQSLDKADAQQALRDLLQKLGLYSQPLIPAAQSMRMANGNCIQKLDAEVRIAGKSLCTADANEQWILDGRGSIRSRADLGLCLTDQGGSNAVKLTACDVRNDNQVWDTSVPKRIARGNRCLDLSSGNLSNNLGRLITYSCTGGGNQQWDGLQPGDSLALSLIDSRYAGYLQALDPAPTR